jgi:hypothetical protein
MHTMPDQPKPPSAHRIATVDRPPEARVAARAALAPAEVSALVRELTPLLRPLLARRRSAANVTALLNEITEAVALDIAMPQDRTGYGPFNGQKRRQEVFSRLDATFGFDSFIETGAYMGTTTEMLAGLGRPVFSCELSRKNFLRAAVRLASFANVSLTNLDSRTFLRCLLGSGTPIGLPFIYLDAHWNDDLPLPEEIDLIAKGLRDFVIFVDDFQQPDAGYGFDRYENGNELTLDFLLTRLTCQAPLTFLVPIAPANTETGYRRGTLVVVPAHLYHSTLSAEPLLMHVADWRSKRRRGTSQSKGKRGSRG